MCVVVDATYFIECLLLHVKTVRNCFLSEVALQMCSYLGKGLLKTCSKFIGGHPCLSAILIKMLCNLNQATYRRGCFPVNVQLISRTPS